ncbi:LOW QUALITY PROTEIN: unconventional myosin-VI-like [Xenia sp. Carnegie-2017]|uniref:LOW QUALITY PROTEIN: unconventional myosin-VI-like n=1 Tax=Xenia sp. Carnegie-2017 TaxID=2897299 RepID=UPI001F038D53|nr:LOW QUALITY PROTEIN: unconventional myosin-VI-like [Xenia sp. Carnegie-2017]
MDISGLFWAPDSVQGFRLGKVIDLGADTISVEPLDDKGMAICAPYERVFPAEKDSEKDVEDNCALMFLNEATLLNNLKIRYKKDLIYTYVADILLAVNPYHEIRRLYSSETMQQYHGKSIGVLPPHVFAIADKAYRDMRSFKESQSVIVSGESGAGKTESTKYILRYLTESWGDGQHGHIEQRIVEANPLLESFGNAKTLRNINSSRFGKYVELHFNEKPKVVGGFISHYLLEKSRICKQSSGERSYHVFYRLCCGAPAELKTSLGITKAKDFHYLNQGSYEVPSLNDTQDYKLMTESMEKVGFSLQEKDNIFRIVAAVMHLGNIAFEEKLDDKQGGCKVCNKCDNSVQFVAKLLKVDPSALKMALTTRLMSQVKQLGGLNASAIKVPLKMEQATAARDALAKALYSHLFDHIVSQVNQCFPFKSSSTYIGVLDIAGFEFFDVNSFEQFCINYCNEKLQQFFNERLLKQEQELYKREGLNVKEINFIDNQDCIDLIESKNNGILILLNEESKLPKSTFQHFTTEVFHKNKGHFRLALPRKSHLVIHRNIKDDEGFLIRHFAGAVCYSTCEFIAKNNDALHGDLENVLQKSQDAFLISLFPKQETDNFLSPTKKKLAFDSIGSKFKNQLNQLMEKLRNTGANFIRCVKPNSSMQSKSFEGGSILSQLECAGMVSVLRLMQEGFPSRTSFSDLYKMYGSYLPQKLAKLDPRTFCQALFRAVGMDPEEFKFGMTKVFFRPGKFAEFDQIMQSDPENLKALVAKVARWIIVNRWKKAIWCAISVQKLANKIKFRAQACITIQKSVKMFLSWRRHRPRYQGIIAIKRLHSQLEIMNSIVSVLKTDKNSLTKQITAIEAEIAAAIQKIKSTMLRREQIVQLYRSLEVKVNAQLVQLQKQKELEKKREEEEKLRKIQEQMLFEKKRREEEERRKKELEEEARIKAEMEVERRKAEEEERKRKEIEKAKEKEREEQRRKEEAAEKARQAALEQERLDHELALRLAKESNSNVEPIEQPKAVNKNAKDKKYDLSKWKYAELRDTINTSCDVELLAACKKEFHRRLKVYHEWKNKNKASKASGQEGDNTQRAPQQVLEEAASNQLQANKPVTRLPPRRPQRYFRVPFVKPGDEYRESDFKKRGFWFAHFDGQWIARQLEMHPNGVNVVLVAGTDDLDMCELSLDETGLTRKRGAEITKREFEYHWQKCGGRTDAYKAPKFE